MKAKKEKRKKEIREHLLKFGNITSIEAINKFGNTRLAATIFNLKDKGNGMDITDKWECNEESRWKRYYYSESSSAPEPYQRSLF
jgi:hypothetical protein